MNLESSRTLLPEELAPGNRSHCRLVNSILASPRNWTRLRLDVLDCAIMNTTLHCSFTYPTYVCKLLNGEVLLVSFAFLSHSSLSLCFILVSLKHKLVLIATIRSLKPVYTRPHYIYDR